MWMLIGWSVGSDVMRMMFGADTVDADWLIGGERYHEDADRCRVGVMRMLMGRVVESDVMWVLIGAEWHHAEAS